MDGELPDPWTHHRRPSPQRECRGGKGRCPWMEMGGPRLPSPGLMIGLLCHRSSLKQFKPRAGPPPRREDATFLPSLPTTHFSSRGRLHTLLLHFHSSRVCRPLRTLRRPRLEPTTFVSSRFSSTQSATTHSILHACDHSFLAASQVTATSPRPTFVFHIRINITTIRFVADNQHNHYRYFLWQMIF